MTTQGERLKQIRQALRLSQDEFGKKLNVSKQYVSNLEAARNFLNNEKLVSLLVDFNVNINFLLAGVGKMFITPEYDTVKNELRLEVLQILKDEGIIK